MKAIKQVIGVLAVCIVSLQISTAQTADAKGCKDSPLFSRLSGYYIDRCIENYNLVSFPTGLETKTEVEGNVIVITYFSNAEKLPTGFQVIKNYENIVLAKGGKKIFADYGGSGYQPSATYQFSENKLDYWIGINKMIGVPAEGVSGYDLIILSKESAK